MLPRQTTKNLKQRFVMNTFSIQYRYILPDDSEEIFDLQIDADSLKLNNSPPQSLPDWTRKDFYECPNCSLLTKDHPHCPLAVNLVILLQRFDRLLSYEQIHVDVIVKERKYSKNTTAQIGISSLMGLLIATSACPLTDFLKPMARFHLPFANEEETIWRAASTYLLVQYYLNRQNQMIDLNLEGLAHIYEDIQVLNAAMSRRLQAVSQKDSTVNALIHLDVFAKYLTPDIKQSMDKIRNTFLPFLVAQKS